MALFLFAVALLVAAPSFAASPDALGPWADTVVSTTQGLTVAGNPVPAQRSDATAALGIAENNQVEGTFYSLGFGGNLNLGFENGISSGVVVVEATNLGYPTETANVEVSVDGTTWYLAGNVAQDGAVSVPENVGCFQYVRLTDTSNSVDFLADPSADGYDVDGVMAQGVRCTNEGRMTGGGSVFMQDNTRVTHGFQLSCDPNDERNNLQVNWGKGNKFHMEDLMMAHCTDAGLNEEQPQALFDTYHGVGTGRYNGVAGYTAEWYFTDDGEPGKDDTANIVIKDAGNNVILTVAGNLKIGNHQAH